MSLRIITNGGVHSLVNDNEVIVNNDNREVSIINVKGNPSYTENDVKEAVNKLNKELEKERSHAEYSVYKKLNIITIKIINDETEEVIMELPPEKILDFVSKMCELNGVIVDKDV